MSARAYRSAMAAGVAFPVLLFIGVLMTVVSAPDTKDGQSAEQVARAYAALFVDSSDRTRIIVGSVFLMLAAVALLAFASALAGRLTRPGSPMRPFATLAAVGVAATMVGPLALAGGITFGSEPAQVDGNVARAVFGLSYPCLLVIFALACAAFIATACLNADRAGWPRWLVVFGWIAAGGGVLGLLFLPLLFTLLWFIAAGVVELGGRENKFDQGGALPGAGPANA